MILYLYTIPKNNKKNENIERNYTPQDIFILGQNFNQGHNSMTSICSFLFWNECI